MKKGLILLFYISFLSYQKIVAQGGGVGINDTGNMPDASAILDVSSTNKGILIPRISLTDTADATTISSATTSLIVHNTNAAMDGGSGVGLYQWNGDKWIKLIAPENGPGVDGDVLTSKGPAQAPVWKTAASGGGGCLNKMQTFTSSGTWTRPTGVDVVYVTLVGGGGGGRGSNGSSNGGNGGGGAQAFFNYPVAVTGDVAVTVGNGGTGGIGGAFGTDGGNSSFSTLVAIGGSRAGNSGSGNFDITNPTGSAAGSATVNTDAVFAVGRSDAWSSSGGAGGQRGTSSNPAVYGFPCGAYVGGIPGGLRGGGGGGASSFGNGGRGGTQTVNGTNGSGYGSGGGGGGGNASTNGGNGTPGLVIVQWSE